MLLSLFLCVSAKATVPDALSRVCTMFLVILINYLTEDIPFSPNHSSLLSRIVCKPDTKRAERNDQIRLRALTGCDEAVLKQRQNVSLLDSGQI